MQTFRRGVRGQRRWRLWHAIIAALALLTFSGDVYQTAHLLLTVHVRCPFDGALVHEDELSLSERALDAASTRASQPVSVVPRHEHGDCAAHRLVHRFAAIVVPVRDVVRGAEAVRVVTLDGSDIALARSVLSYAPKLSPPAD